MRMLLNPFSVFKHEKTDFSDSLWKRYSHYTFDFLFGDEYIRFGLLDYLIPPLALSHVYDSRPLMPILKPLALILKSFIALLIMLVLIPFVMPIVAVLHEKAREEVSQIIGEAWVLAPKLSDDLTIPSIIDEQKQCFLEGKCLQIKDVPALNPLNNPLLQIVNNGIYYTLTTEKQIYVLLTCEGNAQALKAIEAMNAYDFYGAHYGDFGEYYHRHIRPLPDNHPYVKILTEKKTSGHQLAYLLLLANQEANPDSDIANSLGDLLPSIAALARISPPTKSDITQAQIEGVHVHNRYRLFTTPEETEKAVQPDTENKPPVNQIK